MTRKQRAPTSEEIRLWRNVVRDVAPWRPEDAPPAPVPPALIPPLPPPPPGGGPVTARPAAPRATRLPLPAPPASPPAPGPLLPDTRGGLDRRTDERLRRGKLDIDGRIDLHGLTQAEAHEALIGFVLRGHREGRRTLLVITGKGGRGDDGAYTGGGAGRGVLRFAVPRWLGESPLRALVLAIRQAQPHHGGGGAFYVLLRRQRA